MSIDPSRDPATSDAPTPQPFEEQPLQLPSPRKGCSRMAMAGCAVVVLLIGLGVLTLMLKARDLARWSLSEVRSEIESVLPDDLSTAERGRLDRAFDRVLDRIESGQIDPVALQSLQAEMLRFARLRGEPRAEDIRSLIAALEGFGGEDPGTDPPDVENDR